MKVTQEKLPASRLGLEIEVPGDLSKQVYEQALSKLAREVRLPGFRKGKAPRHILIQSIGVARIKATAIEELVQTGLDKAIEQEKIKSLGNYQLQTPFEEILANYTPGETLTFSATIDVPPSPTIKQYKGLSVQAEEVAYDSDQVDKVLADYQKQSATLIPVEGRAAQMEDVVVVDFSGVLDLPADAPEDSEPSPIPGGKGDDFQVELSEDRFIPGFVDGIVGMNPGETKEVKATFPESYPQKDVAGKAATFTITLKEIKSRELPALDDDFAQEVSDFETLAELRETLEKRYQDEAADKTQKNKHEAFYKALVEQVEVEIPETMLQRQTQMMIQQTAMNLREQGIDINRIFTRDTVQAFSQQVRPEAINQIKRDLLVSEIANLESLSVEDKDVDAKVQEVLDNASDTKDIDLNRLKLVVHEDLLKNAVMNWLETQNTVELLPEGSLKAEDELGDEPGDDLDDEDEAEEDGTAVEVEVVQ
jgi:trigger factor